MLNTTPIIDYARTQTTGSSGNAYAYAFGLVWASMSDAQQTKLIKYVQAEMKKEAN